MAEDDVAELARTLTRKPLMPVALTNANVFDSATGKSTPGMTVLMEGNHIRAVGKDGADTSGKPAPEAARNRPLNDEDIHRPNWCRHQHADGNAGKHELDAGQHDMRAELQDRAPIRS